MSRRHVTRFASVPRPERLFPLVRQLSWPLTTLLVRLPVTANHVTIAAIAVGLAAAGCFLKAEWLAGALLFVLSFVLDNCDGEVARFKGIESRFGARIDDFGDWVVHSAVFVAMGISASRVYGSQLWLWLGCITAVGVAIENGFQLAEIFATESARAATGATDRADSRSASDAAGGASWIDGAIHVFRVLLDADFCFFVLAFVLSGGVPVLLVGAAIGSHVYWAVAFYGNVRRRHA